MRKAVKYVVLLFVVFIVFLAIFLVFLVSLTKTANEQLIENYAKTYLQEYKNLVETYGSGLGNLSQFNLSGHYNVVGVISKVHGAAVFIKSSSKGSIETKTIPERIEFYVWEVMKQYSDDDFWERQYAQGNEFETYTVSTNLQIGDGKTPTYFYVGEKTVATFTNDYTITVMPLGRLRIDGVLKYENRMILKGSNDERDWSPQVALIEATNEFLRIAKNLILSEAEAKQVEGLAILRAKAEQIERNKATGVYEGNPTLQSKDEQEFWELAEEYGIYPEAAQEIRNFVKERYIQQPWYQRYIEILPEAFIGAVFSTVIVSPILTMVYNRFLRKKVKRLTKQIRPKKRKK